MKQAGHAIDNVFIDPVTQETLILQEESRTASCSTSVFPYENRVIDFNTRLEKSAPESEPDHAIHTDITDHSSSSMRKAQDDSFRAAQNHDGNIYGSLDDFPFITQQAHYRRIEILESIDLGNLSDKVVVDFGTGPWGFAAIFPKLRHAALCIGFDISKVALDQAALLGTEANVIYATSDGDTICLADNSVDVFFAGEVIEHVRKPRLFLQEMARVCKDGAIVILTTPNKDALLYKVQGIPYCYGPEHIALMNNQELIANMSAFYDNVETMGYELSIQPDVDKCLRDPEIVRLVNERAFKFPALASGLIATGRVSKSKYLEGKTDVVLHEIEWSSELLREKIDGTVAPLFGEVAGLSMEINAEFSIPIQTSCPTLLFWGHDWSGIVEISFQARSVTTWWRYDLYLPSGGFYRIDLDLPDGVSEISVKRTGEKSERAVSSQVIFQKFFEYPPLPRH